ncbi:hypothetical protein IFR04_004218 [Cadophora malorum]|uniref:DUF7872 domain-containing protein n=1 Tax=Cadophora malorum TaxID=108018 RepID=A0A8H7WD10_9HELO|nr:hypothetical protein IFR04_004218 [Cadophora malorum]
MLFSTFILAASAIGYSAGSPLPQGTGTGADSCKTDPLTGDIWKTLDIDTFLKDWTAANVTKATTNNIQALSASFGAPNFFCGLDQFCNADQPCLPVTLPAWYALVAIQNWNSYMNSVNTAISFASNIAGLTLPGVVSDFYKKPKDDVTPLKTLSTVFSTTLGMIPFTGAVSTAASAVSGGIGFLGRQLTIPEEPDRFMAWSDISGSLATVVSDYQAAVSKPFKAVIDAPVDDPAGINAILSGGQFLGIAQNFTQTDLQSAVTDSINIFAIGLVLQAQGVFIYRFPNGCTNEDDQPSRLCVPGGDAEGGDAGYLMLKADGDANAESQDDFAKTLMDKYGMTKEQILIAPTACFDANNKQQFANPFGNALPLNKDAQCLFNLAVCGKGDGDWDNNEGIVDNCRKNGVPGI